MRLLELPQPSGAWALLWKELREGEAVGWRVEPMPLAVFAVEAPVIFLWNQSNETLFLEAGATRRLLHPGECHPLVPQEPFLSELQLTGRSTSEGGPIVLRQVWTLDPGTREIRLVLPGAQPAGRLRVRRLPVPPGTTSASESSAPANTRSGWQTPGQAGNTGKRRLTRGGAGG